MRNDSKDSMSFFERSIEHNVDDREAKHLLMIDR